MVSFCRPRCSCSRSRRGGGCPVSLQSGGEFLHSSDFLFSSYWNACDANVIVVCLCIAISIRHVGLWNLIGAFGFTLCAAFGYGSVSTSWLEYQSVLSTFWGSWAFLVSLPILYVSPSGIRKNIDLIMKHYCLGVIDWQSSTACGDAGSRMSFKVAFPFPFLLLRWIRCETKTYFKRKRPLLVCLSRLCWACRARRRVLFCHFSLGKDHGASRFRSSRD